MKAELAFREVASGEQIGSAPPACARRSSNHPGDVLRLPRG
ncbi:MAG: hypothetical protein M5U28_03905 [Sandaracinaceae bacterium]|nr:hypothetical protein [Sandaracinaceae bacterium]